MKSRQKMHYVLAGVMVLSCVTSAFSQGSGVVGAAPSHAAATVNMQQPMPGDHWTYEVKDEISGTIKETRKAMVTDVSKNEVAVHVDYLDSVRSINTVYDQSWNVVRGPVLKFFPNDGSGVKFPLMPDLKWKIAIDEININTGATFKRVGSSRVTGQEEITTKAGTFDTFVIESDVVIRNTKDPTRTEEITAHTWFNPDVNHWIKRNVVTRQGGHLFQNETLELTEYGRKKQ